MSACLHNGHSCHLANTGWNAASNGIGLHGPEAKPRQVANVLRERARETVVAESTGGESKRRERESEVR